VKAVCIPDGASSGNKISRKNEQKIPAKLEFQLQQNFAKNLFSTIFAI